MEMQIYSRSTGILQTTLAILGKLGDNQTESKAVLVNTDPLTRITAKCQDLIECDFKGLEITQKATLAFMRQNIGTANSCLVCKKPISAERKISNPLGNCCSKKCEDQIEDPESVFNLQSKSFMALSYPITAHIKASLRSHPYIGSFVGKKLKVIGIESSTLSAKAINEESVLLFSCGNKTMCLKLKHFAYFRELLHAAIYAFPPKELIFHA